MTRRALALIIVVLALPATAVASPQSKLTSAKDRWRATHLSDYTFDLEISCFCRPLPDPIHLTVKDGKPVDPPEAARGATTVPKIFRIIQSAIDGHAATVKATYGAKGLPRSVYIDRSKMIADEEVTYSSSHLKGQ
jgi:hypothetical protein